MDSIHWLICKMGYEKGLPSYTCSKEWYEEVEKIKADPEFKQMESVILTHAMDVWFRLMEEYEKQRGKSNV